MKAKKFIDKKIEGEYEIKTFHVLDVEEVTTSGIESIIDRLELHNLDSEDAVLDYGICFDYDGAIYCIEVDKFIKGVDSNLAENADGDYWNIEKEQCDAFLDVLKKLEKYKGYDIYL